MTIKTGPKKVIKNPPRPKSQPRKYRVVRHFQPTANSLACHSNINAEIPLVNIENEISPTPAKCSKTLKTVFSAAKKANSVLKETTNNTVSAFERAKSYHITRLQADQKKLKPDHLLNKSSSSSSIETKLEKFTKVRSRSFHAGTSKKPYATKQLYLRSERGSTSQATSSSFKSTTDPALLQKDLNVRSLKQEILENRRANSNVRHPIRHSVIGDSSPRIADLTKEISQSKTNNVTSKKVFITELRSEIAQYKQYKNFFVYNSTEEPSPSKRATSNESSNQSENPSSSSQRKQSGGKRVSISVQPDNINLSYDKNSSIEVFQVKSGNSSRSRSTGGIDTVDTVTER